MIVTMKNILRDSIRTVYHNSKFVILIWAFNAASAFVLAVPIYTVLQDTLSHSLISERLLETFDYFWFIQFRHIYSVQLDQMPLSIYAVLGIYILIQTFFLGGIISVFNYPEKNHIVDFFYGGVKYFFRFVKVLFISLAFILIVLGLHDLWGYLIAKLFLESEKIYWEFAFQLIRYFIMVFLISIVILLSDYLKISLAVRDKTKIISEIKSAILFIKNNFNKVFTLFLLVSVIGVLGVLFYNIIQKFIPRTPAYFLILSFFIQQMLIIFRLLIRMLFYSTSVLLYKDLSAQVIESTGN